MRTLFAFLWKYHFFLLFILLELLAGVFTVRNLQHHGTAFFRFSRESASNVHEFMYDVNSFFNLRRENDNLATENAAFRSMSPGSFIITDNGLKSTTDTLYRQEYSYRIAEAISNPVNRRNNILVLNKGSEQGVEPDMGVIAPDGIVGIVRAVSPGFSSAISMLHSKTRISAEIKGSGYKGYVSWNGANYRKGQLSDVPSHAPLEIGDTVITSADSHIFPRGILIGTVTGFEVNQATQFYEATIEFSCDYNRLRHVMIVENMYKEELDSLISITQPEEE